MSKLLHAAQLAGATALLTVCAGQFLRKFQYAITITVA